jgi:hypothetical protein
VQGAKVLYGLGKRPIFSASTNQIFSLYSVKTLILIDLLVKRNNE